MSCLLGLVRWKFLTHGFSLLFKFAFFMCAVVATAVESSNEVSSAELLLQERRLFEHLVQFFCICLSATFPSHMLRNYQNSQGPYFSVTELHIVPTDRVSPNTWHSTCRCLAPGTQEPQANTNTTVFTFLSWKNTCHTTATNANPKILNKGF